MFVDKLLAQGLTAAVLAGVTTLVLSGCGGGDAETQAKKPQPGGDFTPVIAEVGDVSITRGYFDFRYDNLSPQDKARYSGEGWETRFLDKLIEEMLVTESAEREGYHRIREVEWRLDMSRRSILHKAYYERNFQDQIEVPESELRDYFDRNPDNFLSMGRVYGHHIVTSSEQRIREAWSELQAERPFAAVALEYSEDETTRKDGGTVGWFNRDGFVLGLGFNSEFTRIAFEMEPHSIREPVKIDDKWHIIRIGAKYEDEPQRFEAVRERISRQLMPVIAHERYDDFIRATTKDLGVRRFGEFRGETRSADQLYQFAAESRNPHARLYFYEALADLYPEHERADDALFMLGFLNSEEFGDVATAMKAFRRLQRDYPESEFVEQSHWLMKNLAGSSGLRGSAAPRDASDAAQRLREQQ